MIRETSVEAYHEVLESGLIGRRQKQVYTILYQRGPLAGAQVAAQFLAEHGRTARSETIRNRLTELRDRGVVREVGTVKDPNTKKRVILWDVTRGSPVKPPRKETKNEIIRRLEARVKELETLLKVGSGRADIFNKI